MKEETLCLPSFFSPEVNRFPGLLAEFCWPYAHMELAVLGSPCDLSPARFGASRSDLFPQYKHLNSASC